VAGDPRDDCTEVSTLGQNRGSLDDFAARGVRAR
jgi:hypothetical protein